MLENEPLVSIRNLVRDNFDPTPLARADLLDPQDFSTGSYDYGSGGQQITFTNPTEDVVEGGSTGYTAGTGDGGTSNIVVGSFLLSVWPGTRDECKGIGPNGEDVNPKVLGYQFSRQIVNIIRSHPNGVGEMNSLGVPGAERAPDDDGAQIIYRWQMRPTYTYGERRSGRQAVADGGP